MGDEGFGYLLPALEGHPKLKSIDLGDCGLGDEGIRSVCSLISNTEDKPGLLELTLTGNREVTQVGWTQLAMSIANGCSLRSLFLDYNNIGDFGAGVFAVALAASKTLHVVDFEGCGITDAGAELLCDSLTGYATSIKELNLAENKISEDVLEEVKECLLDNNQVAGNLSSRGRSSPQGKAKTPEQ